MNPYALFGGLVLLIAVYFGGHHQGARFEQAAWQGEKLAMQAAHIAHVNDEFNKYVAADALQKAKARKASEDHEKLLLALDQKHLDTVADIRRLGGLRFAAPAACRGPAATAPQSPGARRPDEEDARTVRIPDDVEGRLFALARRADEVTLQCRSLQAWIRDNGHYGQTE